MHEVREFIYARTQDYLSPFEEFFLWLLDQHTVETGQVDDLGGSDTVTYCGGCGQDLDDVAACDHLLRLAAVWPRHPDYRTDDWKPIGGADE